jgi:AraC-like DNA-binding protein
VVCSVALGREEGRTLAPWLERTKIKIKASPSGLGAWDWRVDPYLGEMVTVLNLSSQGLSELLFRNHPGMVTLGIGAFGQFNGSAGGQPFSCVPSRLSWLLLGGDVLQVQADSVRIAAMVIQVPEHLLLGECKKQGLQEPDVRSLVDTLPGQESLLLACSQQLLRLAIHPASAARACMASPLEASMLYILASLVGRRSTGHRLAMEDPQAVHVDNAMAYMEQRMAETITLQNLCEACHISSRTLQVAFQSVWGRTPLQALQEMRLTHLRHLLVGRSDIREACAQVGLLASGRMAANYKRLFGELPSQTQLRAGQALLRQSSRQVSDQRAMGNREVSLSMGQRLGLGRTTGTPCPLRRAPRPQPSLAVHSNY